MLACHWLSDLVKQHTILRSVLIEDGVALPFQQTINGPHRCNLVKWEQCVLNTKKSITHQQLCCYQLMYRPRTHTMIYI